MRNCTGGRAWRSGGQGRQAVAWAVVTFLLAACSATAADAREMSPAATTWRESFYENFAMELTADEAECVAAEVDDLSRLVGPLVGQRPDDTANSIWTAIDSCLETPTQGELARAIVLGGWSAGEPAVASVWNSADERLGTCVTAAGGWQALGSYPALMAVCGSTVGAGSHR